VLKLFARLIARPLAAEPFRTALTVFAVALGVAVVIAIDLAGDAAAGSFRSSLETLRGDAALEITATGGVDENLLPALAELPYPLTFRPRIETFARIEESKLTVPLIGLDLLSEELRGTAQPQRENFEDALAPDAVWVSASLGWSPGYRFRMTLNDRPGEFRVAGTLPGRDHFLVMDIAAAQHALGREGLVDRIDVKLPRTGESRDWTAILREVLPAGVSLEAAGAQTDSNRRMLAAFRWNLRVLSYVSLVVGAFLIYNTIAVSVVRRRAEIGVLRAIGATRAQVRLLFLAEAALFGLLGALLGIPLGRLMAEAAVGLLGRTVSELYVSSAPAPIELTPAAILQGIVIAVGAALASAFAPAREASLVPPVEAMARGQREYHARLHSRRNALLAIAIAAAALYAATLGPVDGKPLYGYLACFLLILASALAIPAITKAASRLLAGIARALLGAEGLLAARGLSASLSRTSILAGALSTAVAMMASVGIMVGSFRETVTAWMDAQLRADLYLAPAAATGAGRFAVMSPEVADTIARLPEVADVDRFRLYEIRFRGLPALLGAGQTAIVSKYGRIALMDASSRGRVISQLPTGDYAIVSEPFANKHSVRTGDRIPLRLGARDVVLTVLGVYYDYSNERGYVIIDRKTLLRHLPDESLSSLAVYLKPGVKLDDGRRAVERAIAGRDLRLSSNRMLRREALNVFDRTFAITWALEAVAILVAVLGVAGALLALVIDRRRELSLLRFLGASASQIRRLILAESALLGLLANAIGLVLGSALSLILIRVINKQSFGWTIQFHWPVALLAAALTGIYAATLLAALWPAREALRLNPIEVIHED
jgi:putative ABC transport system permease protein